MIRRLLLGLMAALALSGAAFAQNYHYIPNGIVYAGNGTAEPMVCFEATYGAGVDICLSRSSAGVVAATDGSGNAAAVTGSKLTSTVATGTAPLTVTSTTPVANLTTVPATYAAGGTQLTGVHISTGSVTLSGGAGTLTFTAPAAFTSSTSYTCSATDTTAAAAVKLTYTSGTTLTLAGTSTDVITVLCVGS